MATSSPFPAIPQPVPDNSTSMYETVTAIKENVEVLTSQRGTRLTSAVTWQDLVDLGLIAADQVPK